MYEEYFYRLHHLHADFINVPASVACDSNPCENDAECVSLYVAGEDGNKYKCICKTGTKGTHCETEICLTGKNSINSCILFYCMLWLQHLYQVNTAGCSKQQK